MATGTHRCFVGSMSDQENHMHSTRPLSYGDLRRAIGLVALLLIGFMLATQLRFVLILFAVTLILAMVLNPFVAMLQRKGGATISEIMKAMGWQRHTVRGFMAGAMKKAGHSVESFKLEGGERTYRISK